MEAEINPAYQLYTLFKQVMFQREDLAQCNPQQTHSLKCFYGVLICACRMFHGTARLRLNQTYTRAINIVVRQCTLN